MLTSNQTSCVWHASVRRHPARTWREIIIDCLFVEPGVAVPLIIVNFGFLRAECSNKSDVCYSRAHHNLNGFYELDQRLRKWVPLGSSSMSVKSPPGSGRIIATTTSICSRGGHTLVHTSRPRVLNRIKIWESIPTRFATHFDGDKWLFGLVWLQGGRKGNLLPRDSYSLWLHDDLHRLSFCPMDTRDLFSRFSTPRAVSFIMQL